MQVEITERSLRSGHAAVRLAVLAMALAVVSPGQTMPSREYIRLGDRIVAIESSGATITPTSARLKASQTATFSAGFSPVVWTLSPTSGSGTISTAGFYTAPASVPAEANVTVEARQTAGGAVLSTALVVLEPDALMVSPSTQTL